MRSYLFPQSCPLLPSCFQLIFDCFCDFKDVLYRLKQLSVATNFKFVVRNRWLFRAQMSHFGDLTNLRSKVDEISHSNCHSVGILTLKTEIECQMFSRSSHIQIFSFFVRTSNGNNGSPVHRGCYSCIPYRKAFQRC